MNFNKLDFVVGQALATKGSGSIFRPFNRWQSEQPQSRKFVPDPLERRDLLESRTSMRGHFVFALIACSIALSSVAMAQHSVQPHSVQPLFAPALKPGDTVMIVAPAGPMTRDDDREDIARALEVLKKRGLKVKLGNDLFRQTGYLAGSDDTRIDELNAAFRDPEVNAIFAGRGGFGTTRIVDRLDFEAIRKNPKILTGFSDITALHIAIAQETGLVTFHSPNAVWGLGYKGGMPAPAKHYFWRALMADRFQSDAGYSISATGWSDDFGAAELKQQCELDPPTTLTGGTARGRLIGGNLSLIAALMGTPYQPKTKGNILFIEDVGEAPYRVDRMLSTMRLAGLLDGLRGVLIGQFSWRADQEATDDDITTDEVLDSYFKPLGIPVIKNFPAGHLQCNITLPIGAMYEINADTQTMTLLENPVRLD